MGFLSRYHKDAKDVYIDFWSLEKAALVWALGKQTSGARTPIVDRKTHHDSEPMVLPATNLLLRFDRSSCRCCDGLFPSIYSPTTPEIINECT